jgi:uncharacterized membrane protein HdeD (DUF308 family)
VALTLAASNPGLLFPRSNSKQSRFSMATQSTSYAQSIPTIGGMLTNALSQSWWILLLRGFIAVAFGVATFIWPSISLFALTILWGVYALSDGLVTLGAGLFGKGEQTSSRWWLAIAGIASIAAGVVTFMWPGMTSIVLLMFIAAWAIVVGFMQIWGAFQLRKEISNEWLLGLSGLVSVAFGVLMFMRPNAGALATLWIIGAYAVVTGVLFMALAFKVKSLGQPG